MSKFSIYSSSAGSGKTFTLTKEYLKLALADGKKYGFKNILAITFTNDAANEMKGRILDALKAMADEHFDESSKFWSMFQQIVEETTLTPELVRLRANEVFHAIIQDYSDFSVKTIDSFVNQLVAAFTEDLGLPYNYEIVLDKDSVLLEAVERLIEKAGQDEYRDISKVLEEFVLNKAEEGKSWNFVSEELAKFGENLLNDQFYTSINKIKGIAPAEFRLIRANIIAFLQWFENEIVGLATQAVLLMENNGVSPDDFSYKRAGGAGIYYYQLAENFYEKLREPVGARVRDAIENDKWYAKSTPIPTQLAIDSIKGDLIEIFEKVHDLRQKHFSKYLLFHEIRNHFYKLSLLSKIKTEFDEILLERNQVYISEFNRKILEIVLNEPVPFIYERIGEKYDHLLIDEFQDTSEMQFYNLLPLIENSLARHKFNLLVGDAKQSIYRWRGGKMELIVYLYRQEVSRLDNSQLIGQTQTEQLFSMSHFIEPKSLNTNFRSTKEIIEFNNEFFDIIRQNHQTVFPFLSKVYDDDFQQKLPQNPLTGGHIEIEFLEKDRENLAMLARIEETIHQSLSEGFQLKDIAILSRKNVNTSLIANYLTERGFEVISRDSLLLKNSGAIRLLISNLKVLNNPDNTLAKYEAAYLYHQIILHQVPDNEANKQIKADIEQQKSTPNTHNWGLYDLTESLIKKFNLFENTSDKAYLFRFLDIVLEFSIKESNHLQDFLKYWDEHKNQLSVKSSAEHNAITINTIHRSKGLEYPIVIIPFADWKTSPRSDSVFWADLETTDYQEFRVELDDKTIQLKSSPMSMKGELLDTEVALQYAGEVQSDFMENLNMLYVAFTRPIHKLVVLSHLNRWFKPEGVGKFLHEYLQAKNLWNDAQRHYLIQQGNHVSRKTEKADNQSVITIEKVINEDRSDRLRLRRISEKVFDADTLDKQKDLINKVKAALLTMLSVNEAANALRELAFEGTISQSEMPSIKKYIEEVVNLPLLKPLFEPNLKVENEREILIPNQEIQKPDRVVFLQDAVYIIDYKTVSYKDFHEKQMQRYKKSYQAMGFQNVNLYLLYLENKEVKIIN